VEESLMTDDEQLTAGEAARRRILGDEWVDRSYANRNAFNSDWVDRVTRSPWADVWTRPHFDDRTRRILVMGTMIALGTWDELRLHVRAALTQGGFTPRDLAEIIMQQAACLDQPHPRRARAGVHPRARLRAAARHPRPGVRRDPAPPGALVRGARVQRERG
jgi:alkylhydroperoxidase/carboxymuconolactone decarboxylase family protein YurZ